MWGATGDRKRLQEQVEADKRTIRALTREVNAIQERLAALEEREQAAVYGFSNVSPGQRAKVYEIEGSDDDLPTLTLQPGRTYVMDSPNGPINLVVEGVSAGQTPNHTLSRSSQAPARCSCGWISDDHARYGAAVQFGEHVFDVTPVDGAR